MIDHKPITYIGKCGCHLVKDATRRKNGYSRVCRVHREKIIRAERECLDCDKILQLKPTGKGPQRCEWHIAIRKADASRDLYYRNKEKKATQVPVSKPPVPGKWSIDKRGDYCMWLKSCLGSGKLSCDICRKFVGIFMGHDPQSLEQFTV